MDQWYIVDANGFLVDVITSDTVVHLIKGFRIVKRPWPDGMYKPRHILETGEWVSGETPEEKAAREALENQPKPETTEEKASRLETELAAAKEDLKAAHATATEANEFSKQAAADQMALMEFLGEKGLLD